ncbi:MAG: hypothetical protein ACI4HM_09285 [Ruminococcus sp.]
MKRITSLIIIATVVLSSLVFTTGCTKKQEVDLSKYLSYEGFSGFATLEEQPKLEDYETKYDDLKEKRKEARLDEDDNKYDEYTEEIKSLRNLNKALECVELKLVKGENGNLSNGDTIKVKAKYNEEKLDKYDVTFVADEFETKVKGLEEKEVVDPFDSSNLSITYHGLDGEGTISLERQDDSEYTIYYTAEPNYDLKNGDKITITASLYDEDYILKDSENGESATKEITVEGLGEIPEKLSSSVDSTVPTKAILDELKEDYEAEVGDDDEGYSFGIKDENYVYSDLKINKVTDFKLEKTLYGYTDDNYGKKSCNYAQIYSRTFTVKMVDPSYSSKVKKGAVKKVTAYYLGYISGGYLMVSDNKLVQVYDYDMYCSTSVHKTVSDAQKYFKDSYKSNYTITEVK